MRLGFLFLVLIATVFGSVFWYDQFDTTCRVPIHYRIGDTDSRFGTSADEIKRIASRSENMWEIPLSANLFVYDESPKSIPINLVYDERQESATHEAEVRADLEAKEGMSETVAQQYEKLIAEFRLQKKKYESQVIAYEKKLDAYNAEVAKWNSQGGAPEDVVLKLQGTEKALKSEQSTLEALAKKLNALTTELNRIGARGNELITNYNSIVEKYNAEFSEGQEFTQGEYTHDAINIYQFDAEEELVIVLAHEFGHALSLDHVENKDSVMFHLMGSQTIEKGITTEDRAEYVAVCKQKSFMKSLVALLSPLFAL